MRQCPLKYKECPLKRPLSGRVVRSFEIQVAKTTNGQKNGSAEESTQAQKVVEIGTGSGSKAILRPFCLHSQMHFTTVHPSDSNKGLSQNVCLFHHEIGLA